MDCLCGCGGEAIKQRFKPGHDQKLRISLEQELGGIDNLQLIVKVLVEYRDKKIGLSELGRVIDEIFGQGASSQGAANADSLRE